MLGGSLFLCKKAYNTAMKYISKSSIETKKIAAELAARVLKRRPGAQAFIITLEGELGAGKTTFVQGFVGELGINEKVKSPTFLLIKNYRLANSRFKDLYHIDCYRIDNWKELEPLEIKQILNNPENIVLVEWPERISPIIPRVQIRVKLEHINPETRSIEIT
jgi:tRNA threonylcarbamoyl adenosine modification protein YjeE